MSYNSIGIITKDSPEARDFSSALVIALRSKGLKIADLEIQEPDLVISVGGDGCFLRALHTTVSKWGNVPVFPLNMGTVGFLTEDVKDKTLTEIVDFLLENPSPKQINLPAISNFLHLPESLHYHDEFIINEICIRSLKKLIKLKVLFNDKEICTYRADGLVVSTSFGSTAYNLSLGGPIIYPETDVLTITPIAPFSLSARPIILPIYGRYITNEIQIIPDGNREDYSIILDGMDCPHISKPTIYNYQTVSILRYKYDFLEALKTKLEWSKERI